MREEITGSHRRIVIEAGEYYASNGPSTISTLLGSCVAACLFDPVNKVIGMNHFMLSGKRYDKDFIIRTEAGRYGVHAMELLINEMLKLGAERKFLHAKAFGGSSLIGNNGLSSSNFSTVGKVNCRFIRDFLELEGIPLVSESLGGTFGRMIHFSYANLVVYMRRIESTDKGRRVARNTCTCLEQSGSEPKIHNSLNENVEIWK